MVGLSKRRYGLLALWVIGASALGIYLVRHVSPAPPKDVLAPQAQTRQCGPKDVSADEEKKFSSDWIANNKDLSDEARRAVIRVVRSLPEGVAAAFKAPGAMGDKAPVKIALDQGKWPFACLESERSSSRIASSCLKMVSGMGRVLVLGRSTVVSSEGRPRQLSDEEFVDQTLLPAIFWLAFERLGNLRDEKSTIPESDISKANVFSQIKHYIVGGYKFSPEEEDFYYREFGASGTATPAFINRTLTLTASNLYCDAESFDRLNKKQPEAVKRFMSAVGCSLGRAWHMSDDNFTRLCPKLASRN